MIVIQALPGRDGPNITVGIEEFAQFSATSGWGKHLPPSSHGSMKVEVPVGPRLNFYWSGKGQNLAGNVTGYRYALDIDDIGDDRQWSPWSLDHTAVTYQFEASDAGEHHFYLQAKDNGGGVSFVILNFTVVSFTFDQGILFVDDYVNFMQFGMEEATKPTDEVHDSFWRRLLASAGLVEDTDDGYRMWEGWNYAEPEKRQCYIPPLEEITRYRAVIWLTSQEWAGYTAYYKSVADPRIANVLGSYITGGGRVWLLGRGTIRTSFYWWVYLHGQCIALDESQKDTFGYRYLHLQGTRVCCAKAFEGNQYGLHLARSNEPALPDLSLDIMPGGRFEEAFDRFKGLANVEAIVSPLERPDIDTLYYYFSLDSLEQSIYPKSYSMYGKPCATRWQDPAQRSEVIWFAFPLYYFEQEKSEEVVKVLSRELLRP